LHRKGLVIGILILMLSVNIGSTFAGNTEVKTRSLVGFDGNTLYVGGTGPNNYTTIQGAIDDAVDGDTVFVYDESSPYKEKVIVNKSIDLIGENRNTTIIDYDDNSTIFILSDSVTVSGFKIKGDYDGIYILSINVVVSDNIFESDSAIDCIGDYNKISDNIINSPFLGINIDSSNNTVIENTINTHSLGGISLHGDDNIASDNIIMNTIELYQFPGDIEIFLGDRNIVSNNTLIAMDNDNRKGIRIWINSQNNIIENNTIIGFEGAGIVLTEGDNNRIYHNTIDNCRDGIYIEKSRKNIVDFNEINNCIDGMDLRQSNSNTIANNNFLNNTHNAFFSTFSFFNTWDGNYWDEEQESPYVIKGKLFLFIPWFNFDWRPAQKPYDIGV